MFACSQQSATRRGEYIRLWRHDLAGIGDAFVSPPATRISPAKAGSPKSSALQRKWRDTMARHFAVQKSVKHAAKIGGILCSVRCPLHVGVAETDVSGIVAHLTLHSELLLW